MNVGGQLERESSCRGVLLAFESPLRFPVVRGRGTEGGLVVQQRSRGIAWDLMVVRD